MTDKNYLARHRRLVNSDTYGPMYRKLSKADQRHVDELVRRNAGGAARSELKDLDAARRGKVAHRSKLRRRVDTFNKLPDDQRTRQAGLDLNTENDQSFWQMYEHKHPETYGSAA
jgi:hypothetical protein